MRKISLVAVALAAVAFSAPAAFAQSAKPISLGISAGAVIPVGNLADAYNTGYNGTVSLGFKSYGSPIGLRVDGMYNKLNVKDQAVVSIPGLGPVESLTNLAATANLVYNLPGTGITPYLIGGAGVYGTKFHVNGSGNDSDTETDPGVNGGIGAAFQLSGFNTFIEARLHNIFTDRESTRFIPVTFGISF